MKRTALGVVALALLIAVAAFARQNAFPSDQRTKVLTMLSEMRAQIAEHYYDDKFGGLNLGSRYDEYKQKIQNARSVSEGLRLVAAFVAGLKDSGTFFLPPALGNRQDYGYRLQMIGDRCFVTQLRPGSDAAAKVHIGDEVLLLNRYSLNRDDLWQLLYTLNSLQPAKFTEFKLRSLDGQINEVTVNSTPIYTRLYTNPDRDGFFNNGKFEMEELTHELRQRHAEIGDVMIWKMPTFSTPRPDELVEMVEKARKYKTLILDLRASGGAIEPLEKILGSFVPANAEIAQRRGRKAMNSVVARKWAGPFEGTLLVLVDSSTSSAAELFARTIQLQHRGLVIGDRTAGRVSDAHVYVLGQNALTTTVYGISVTEDELIMPDGKQLEGVGVTPDELLLPTVADLTDGRDPVLAHAVEKAGEKLDPKAAGALFPFEWRPLSLTH